MILDDSVILISLFSKYNFDFCFLSCFQPKLALLLNLRPPQKCPEYPEQVSVTHVQYKGSTEDPAENWVDKQWRSQNKENLLNTMSFHSEDKNTVRFPNLWAGTYREGALGARGPALFPELAKSAPLFQELSTIILWSIKQNAFELKLLWRLQNHNKWLKTQRKTERK